MKQYFEDLKTLLTEGSKVVILLIICGSIPGALLFCAVDFFQKLLQ